MSDTATTGGAQQVFRQRVEIDNRQALRALQELNQAATRTQGSLGAGGAGGRGGFAPPTGLPVGSGAMTGSGELTRIQQLQGALGQATPQLAQFNGGMGMAAARMSAIAGPAGLAVAAITAVTAVTALGVRAFMQYADSIRTVTEASGMNAEQASRLAKVAGDYSISTDTLARSFTRLARSVNGSNSTLSEYGVTARESEDSQRSMLVALSQVADAYTSTHDPLERARIGNEAFGRSWADLVPLLEQGGDALQAAFADVGDQHIMSDEDLRQAREFGILIGDIKDEFSAMGRALGREIIPALIELFRHIRNGAEQVAGLLHRMGELGDTFRFVVSPLWGLVSSLGSAHQSMSTFEHGVIDAQDALRAATEAAREAREEFDRYNGAVRSATQMAIGLVAAKRRLADANDGVASAQQAVIDAEREYQMYLDRHESKIAGIVSAQRGYERSMRSLSDARGREQDAINRVAEAQENLDRIIRGAPRTAEEARMRVEEAQDRAGRAALNLNDLALQSVLDPNARAEELSLSARAASREMTRATWDHADAMELVNTLDREGIEGTDEYKRAVGQLDAAHDGVASAIQGRLDAEEAVQESQRAMSQAEAQYATDTEAAGARIETAKRGVEDAHWNVVTAAAGLDSTTQDLYDTFREFPDIATDVYEELGRIAGQSENARDGISEIMFAFQELREEAAKLPDRPLLPEELEVQRASQNVVGATRLREIEEASQTLFDSWTASQAGPEWHSRVGGIAAAGFDRAIGREHGPSRTERAAYFDVSIAPNIQRAGASENMTPDEIEELVETIRRQLLRDSANGAG